MDWQITIIVICLIVMSLCLVIWLLDRAKQIREAKREAELEAIKKRREYLINRFGDEEIADRIMNRDVWQGATDEMLQESLGKPVAIDEEVLKTKIKHTWKYNPTGKNQYAIRINLENNVVVGWNVKE